ncbi:MAG: hypothetical protein ACRDQH_11035, partial [Pseudonocardiaceae bacterium]
ALTAPVAFASGPGVIVKVHQASRVISPYFRLTVRPGRTITAGALELVNPTGRTERVTLDPVDAITTNTLGSAYKLPNAGVHGPTGWLRLSARTVTLPGHGHRSVAVTVAVPATGAAGDYLAGVAVQARGQTHNSKVTSGVAIGEIDRYVIGVELTIPGPRRPALQITGAKATREPSGLTFLVSARNTGNVILQDVHGSVRVTTTAGRRVAATTIAPGTFVTATSINYPLPAGHEQPIPGARYRVQATLHYPGGVARLDRTVTFSHAAAVAQQSYGGRKLPHSSSPWPWILAAVALVVLVAGVGAAVRRRRRPLTRAAGLRLLERYLQIDAKRPVSIARVLTTNGHSEAVAAAIKPRLRRADGVCDLGPQELLMICPATSDRAAAALREDLLEQLTRAAQLAGIRVQISVATAPDAMPVGELLALAGVTEPESVASPVRAVGAAPKR